MPTLAGPSPSPYRSPAAASPWVRDDRWSALLALLVWLLLLLMIVPDGFDYAALNGSAPASGSAASRLAWLLLLGVAGSLIAWRSALAWLVLRQLDVFLLPFLVLAAASVAWSIAPDFTLRRLIRVLTCIAVALAFTLVGWQRRRFEDLLRPLLTLLMAGSIVFSLLRPDLAVHHDMEAGVDGAWRGLTNHKNTLGMLAAIGLLLWTQALLGGRARRGAVLAGGALCLVCLVMSRSSTSLMTTLLSLPLLALMMRAPAAWRPYLPWIVAACAVLLVLYAVAVLRLVPGLDSLLKPVAALTGKDLSFTGRSRIWELVGDNVRLHPLLGSGYGAYWIGPTPMSPSYIFVPTMYFYPGSGHNGYLDVVNDLGALGLACLLGYLGAYVMQGLQLLRSDREQAALLLALFIQQALGNFSESHWFNSLSVGFGIMVLASLSLARARLELQLRRHFGEPLLLPVRPPATGAAR
ncbi:O-antigen ligase family protein [Solimonas soli]|uniref:O-antigen ligase family protein n=1 Tax=Solimonas soli TaxID=413479 RepID=UPI000480D9BC|nr:O-antigen ligase family protein [Solimonas soli]